MSTRARILASIASLWLLVAGLNSYLVYADRSGETLDNAYEACDHLPMFVPQSGGNGDGKGWDDTTSNPEWHDCLNRNNDPEWHPYFAWSQLWWRTGIITAVAGLLVVLVLIWARPRGSVASAPAAPAVG